MKKLVFIALGLAFIAVFTSGCSRAEELDKEAVFGLVESDTVWFNANTSVDSTGTSTLLLDTTKNIVWWRGPQTHDTAVTTVIVTGDSAWVEWSRHNYGKLAVLAQVGLETKDTIVLWQKDIVETVKIRGIYRRTGAVSDSNRGWTLEKITCAVGSSDSANTVNIDSVHISSSGYDFTITDPLNTYYDLDSLVTFHSGEAVTVTLYANKAETEAFIHSFILLWPFYWRGKFTSDGAGVHEGTWNAQLIPFPRFAIFDLLGHSTLWEESGLYDFSGVLFPYNIVYP